MSEQLDSEKIITLLRHELASIDMNDIYELEKDKLDEAELMERAGASDSFYRSHFEKVLKLFIWAQLIKIGTEAQNQDQLMFNRGIINGLVLLQNWFSDQISISHSKFRTVEEPPEKGEI
jgi:hypothetical protein